MIGPQRLKYPINNVICPALEYQFSIAPCSLPLLRPLSYAISSVVEKHLHLSNDFSVLFIFSDCAFGAKEIETVRQAKLLGDLYTALQKGFQNNKIADAFFAQ
jgi:hypothetical protein